MARIQRVAQYIQQLAYESLFQPEEREDRPEDVVQRAPAPTRNYADWSAASFSVYVPYRSPPNG